MLCKLRVLAYSLSVAMVERERGGIIEGKNTNKNSVTACRLRGHNPTPAFEERLRWNEWLQCALLTRLSSFLAHMSGTGEKRGNWRCGGPWDKAPCFYSTRLLGPVSNCRSFLCLSVPRDPYREISWVSNWRPLEIFLRCHIIYSIFHLPFFKSKKKNGNTGGSTQIL